MAPDGITMHNRLSRQDRWIGWFSCPLEPYNLSLYGQVLVIDSGESKRDGMEEIGNFSIIRAQIVIGRMRGAQPHTQPKS